jgi:hypothetical protein
MAEPELRELLDLLKGADSVELKLTVPEAEHPGVARALGIDPLAAEIRQVYFFDSKDLALNDHGLVVRARRVQRKGGDSVVKLRPVVPAELPGSLRKAAGFTVEVDAMPGGFVCSGTLKRKVDDADVRKVGLGKRPLSSLLSKRQRALAVERGPDGLDLDGLLVLGPVLVLKLKWDPDGFERRMVAELWLYPDGSRVLELSTKCSPADAFQAAAEARTFLEERGVDTTGEQATKTKKALEFYAGADC